MSYLWQAAEAERVRLEEEEAARRQAVSLKTHLLSGFAFLVFRT